MKDFEDKVFDFPKKPRSGFALYVKDRMPDIKEEKKDISNAELLKIIAKEWKEERVVDPKEYSKQSEKEQKRFKKQLKEFEKYGYYTKSRGEKLTDEDEEEDKKSSRKSSKKKSASRSKSNKKSGKKSASKSQKKEGKSRSKSKKGKNSRK